MDGRTIKASVLFLLFVGLPVGAVAQTSGTPAKKFRVLANATYNATSRSFDERSTFDAFLEQGSTNRSYSGGDGIGLEVGAIYNVTPELGIMGSFEIQSAEHDATFDISTPHPLFFNQPRSANGEQAGLDYQERAINVDGVYTFGSGAIAVDVFGGVTFFSIETELIGEITTDSVYPFDEIEITNADTIRLDESPLGFNVGAAFTYYITPSFGVSGQAKFSRATVTLERDGADPIEIDAGGFRVGGGIRIAF